MFILYIIYEDFQMSVDSLFTCYYEIVMLHDLDFN